MHDIWPLSKLLNLVPVTAIVSCFSPSENFSWKLLWNSTRFATVFQVSKSLQLNLVQFVGDSEEAKTFYLLSSNEQVKEYSRAFQCLCAHALLGHQTTHNSKPWLKLWTSQNILVNRNIFPWWKPHNLKAAAFHSTLNLLSTLKPQTKM